MINLLAPESVAPLAHLKHVVKSYEMATDVVNYMRLKKYSLSDAPDTYNIVYVEGMNPDGTLNNDALDGWNDLRLVLQWKPQGWTIVHNAVATTEPGRVYVQQPINPRGAARIAFGQYSAWRMGRHQQTQPALVQVAPVTVHRDLNRNGIRDLHDRKETGIFGINQHTTRPGFSGKMVGRFSAGCLVGRDYVQHMEFLRLISRDARFLENPVNYLFTTTIIPGDDLHRLIRKK